MQVGGALSPLVVVPIQMRYGWRTSFYIFGLVGVAWAIVWFWWFRNTPREKRGVSTSELREIGDPPTRQRHALPWSVVVRSANFWAILLMGFCYGYGSYFFFAWFPTYLVRGRKFTEKELLLAAFLFLVGACANVCSGIISDFLLRTSGLKVARCRVGMAGFACAAVFALLAAVTHSKLGTLVLLCMSYSGICFTQPMIFPTCIEVAKKFPGSMAGAQNTTNQVGSFLSGVLFGYIAKSSGSYDRPLFLLALVLTLGAVLWLKINPEEELVPDEASTEFVTS